MRNLEYLTQEDLPYFRRMAKQGEVIIIELDPVILMDIDIEALFADIEEENTLTEETLQSWIAAHPALLKRQQKQVEAESGMQEERKHGQSPENSRDKEQTIEAVLMSGTLDEEQMEILLAAVGEGFTDEELYMLLDMVQNTENMKAAFQELLGDHALKGIANAKRD